MRSLTRTLACALALCAAAARAEPSKRVVAVVPLGEVPQEVLDTAAAALKARLEVEVRLEQPVPLPEEAFYAPRKRYRAEKLLDWLDVHGPQDTWKVLAITGAELSTTKGKVFDWGIAGLGNLGGKTCVLSTYLYQKRAGGKAALLRRLADVTVHEFGHTLGLPHCETEGCVMADARGKAIASADRSTGQYCEKCRRLAQWGPLVLKPPRPDAGSP